MGVNQVPLADKRLNLIVVGGAGHVDFLQHGRWRQGQRVVIRIGGQVEI